MSFQSQAVHFPYLTSSAFPLPPLMSTIEVEEEVVPPLSPSTHSLSSRSPSQSREASPTAEVYHLLYKNLGEKWKHQADELELGQGGGERQGEMGGAAGGEGMKRKRSSSLDHSNSRVGKSIKMEPESIKEVVIEEVKPILIKSENDESLPSSYNLLRRRSSLPSLPTLRTPPSPKPHHKKLLFSLNSFLKQQSYSVPSSVRNSPELLPTLLPSLRIISIPLMSRSLSHNHSETHSNISSGNRKLELSGLVRSFEKVLAERAEGWKRLEEVEKSVEERWASRNVDDWRF